ncbi:hypothetical protein [Photobacterium sp. 1_MG-2023]|uniref:hypothetical protein n=1 Tax=Photobacterium sp. 1_MG-2023 TaxID=3062646 RepID=UPI0026E3D243|nr:hypothetical protein [Photobacterium sp. 1_MG-2023]MDO6707413.1 hypothetical protein [Photobacterium sp. 1_MG-2023]
MQHPTNARYALMLTLWVILVCLTKNLGLLSMCPNGGAAIQHVAMVQQDAKTSEATSASECELSSQLVQMQWQQLDLFFLPVLGLLLLIAGLFGASRISPPPFREPKVPKRRLHLQFCTFRE